MQPKRTAEQLIFEAAHELLCERDLTDVSVRDIAHTAGITTRAFYNHFPDKFAVVARIYTDHMAPYMTDTLETWTERRSEFLEIERDFFRHTIFYSGQNSLAETIVQTEYDKFALHIDPAVKDDPILAMEVHQGIVYTVNGQLGLYKATLLGDYPITKEEFMRNYTSTWDLMARWIPAVVLEHISQQPNERAD